MNCPNCKEMLVMTDRQGIEIDYCPKCRGVWLDRGELDKLIERSVVQAPPQASPEADNGHTSYRKYDDDYESKRYDPHYKKKKGGFLGDLFDFD